jgi:hypothetical protein
MHLAVLQEWILDSLLFHPHAHPSLNLEYLHNPAATVTSTKHGLYRRRDGTLFQDWVQRYCRCILKQLVCESVTWIHLLRTESSGEASCILQWLSYSIKGAKFIDQLSNYKVASSSGREDSIKPDHKAIVCEMWNGFSWLKKKSVADSCEHDNKPSGSIFIKWVGTEIEYNLMILSIYRQEIKLLSLNFCWCTTQF